MEHYEELADIDMLEPNPSNSKKAMLNAHLGPFWIDSEQKDMDYLWLHCCFKPECWKWSELLASDRVFCSGFHYSIKQDGATGQITNCNLRLVVMGNRMQEDYGDSFVPVLYATSGCIIIAFAAAQDLELHSCYLVQAFIQADKLRLDKGVNRQSLSSSHKVRLKICRPLYGIPSSAWALHLTLSRQSMSAKSFNYTELGQAHCQDTAGDWSMTLRSRFP
eukprot:622947-Rhodomonas_salina.2